jgi:hypothetical protein
VSGAVPTPAPIRVPKDPTLDQLLDAAWAAHRDELLYGSFSFDFESVADAEKYVALVAKKAAGLRR